MEEATKKDAAERRQREAEEAKRAAAEEDRRKAADEQQRGGDRWVASSPAPASSEGRYVPRARLAAEEAQRSSAPSGDRWGGGDRWSGSRDRDSDNAPTPGKYQPRRDGPGEAPPGRSRW